MHSPQCIIGRNKIDTVPFTTEQLNFSSYLTQYKERQHDDTIRLILRPTDNSFVCFNEDILYAIRRLTRQNQPHFKKYKQASQAQKIYHTAHYLQAKVNFGLWAEQLYTWYNKELAPITHQQIELDIKSLRRLKIENSKDTTTLAIEQKPLASLFKFTHYALHQNIPLATLQEITFKSVPLHSLSPTDIKKLFTVCTQLKKLAFQDTQIQELLPNTIVNAPAGLQLSFIDNKQLKTIHHNAITPWPQGILTFKGNALSKESCTILANICSTKLPNSINTIHTCCQQMVSTLTSIRYHKFIQFLFLMAYCQTILPREENYGRLIPISYALFMIKLYFPMFIAQLIIFMAPVENNAQMFFNLLDMISLPGFIMGIKNSYGLTTVATASWFLIICNLLSSRTISYGIDTYKKYKFKQKPVLILEQ